MKQLINLIGDIDSATIEGQIARLMLPAHSEIAVTQAYVPVPRGTYKIIAGTDPANPLNTFQFRMSSDSSYITQTIPPDYYDQETLPAEISRLMNESLDYSNSEVRAYVTSDQYAQTFNVDWRLTEAIIPAPDQLVIENCTQSDDTWIAAGPTDNSWTQYVASRYFMTRAIPENYLGSYAFTCTTIDDGGGSTAQKVIGLLTADGVSRLNPTANVTLTEDDFYAGYIFRTDGLYLKLPTADGKSIVEFQTDTWNNSIIYTFAISGNELIFVVYDVDGQDVLVSTSVEYKYPQELYPAVSFYRTTDQIANVLFTPSPYSYQPGSGILDPPIAVPAIKILYIKTPSSTLRDLLGFDKEVMTTQGTADLHLVAPYPMRDVAAAQTVFLIVNKSIKVYSSVTHSQNNALATIYGKDLDQGAYVYSPGHPEPIFSGNTADELWSTVQIKLQDENGLGIAVKGRALVQIAIY